jgi:predicted nucleotidyltransferase
MRQSEVLASRPRELLALVSDLLVDVPEGTSLLRLIALPHAIADPRGVHVDLCTERELPPALRARILADKKTQVDADLPALRAVRP